eukprot:119667-Chlamydomonas_euryale.AAC.1
MRAPHEVTAPIAARLAEAAAKAATAATGGRVPRTGVEGGDTSCVGASRVDASGVHLRPLVAALSDAALASGDGARDCRLSELAGWAKALAHFRLSEVWGRKFGDRVWAFRRQQQVSGLRSSILESSPG